MARFVFIMQHNLTPEQRGEAEKVGEVVELADKRLLTVPDDHELGREWFVTRATEILAAVGGVGSGDTVQAMGQFQLTSAVNAAALRAGATLLESVTARESVDEPQPDGTVRKTAVFRFRGFRSVYKF